MIPLCPRSRQVNRMYGAMVLCFGRFLRSAEHRTRVWARKKWWMLYSRDIAWSVRRHAPKKCTTLSSWSVGKSILWSDRHSRYVCALYGCVNFCLPMFFYSTTIVILTTHTRTHSLTHSLTQFLLCLFLSFLFPFYLFPSPSLLIFLFPFICLHTYLSTPHKSLSYFRCWWKNCQRLL